MTAEVQLFLLFPEGGTNLSNVRNSPFLGGPGAKTVLRSTHPSTTNPVCERRVDLLVCSLPLHRHSYIGFILAFASSFHNKQPPGVPTPRPRSSPSHALRYSFRSSACANTPVASSTSAARLSSRTSRAKLVWFSLRQQPYV